MSLIIRTLQFFGRHKIFYLKKDCILFIAEINPNPCKNGKEETESKEVASEKHSIKRSNDETSANRHHEDTSSEDESRDDNSKNWNDAKRRRETSPTNIKSTDLPSEMCERGKFPGIHNISKVISLLYHKIVLMTFM